MRKRFYGVGYKASKATTGWGLEQEVDDALEALDQTTKGWEGAYAFIRSESILRGELNYSYMKTTAEQFVAMWNTYQLLPTSIVGAEGVEHPNDPNAILQLPSASPAETIRWWIDNGGDPTGYEYPDPI